MILSFAYPDFYHPQRDPLHIIGFTIAHVGIAAILLSYIVPRWFDSLVPARRREEAKAPTVPLLESTVVEVQRDDKMETGHQTSDEVGKESKKADDVDGDRLSGRRTPQLCDRNIAPF